MLWVNEKNTFFVFSPPILASSRSPSNVYLFAGDSWWKGRLCVGWSSRARRAVSRVKGLFCSGTISLFSLRFPCRCLSLAFYAPPINVFLSPCWDDSSSVDFSHCRPLFPCFICPPCFCLLLENCTECCSLTFPSYAPMLAMSCQQAPPPTPTTHTPSLFFAGALQVSGLQLTVCHFGGKTLRFLWELQLWD